MPKSSKKYCKTTPVSKMGFTQRSSCKAQGFIPRSDGTIRVSNKYKMNGKEVPPEVASKIMDYIYETPTARAREILKTKKSLEKILGIPTTELLTAERERFIELSNELHYELKEFNPERVYNLIMQGADPNTTDENGYPVLYYAVNLGLPVIVEELLKRGASPYFTDSQEDTLLHTAARAGNLDIIQMLNIDPNYINIFDMTPLNIAVSAREPDIKVVRALLNKGADPDDGSIDFLPSSNQIYKLLFRRGARSAYWEQDLEIQKDLERTWDEMERRGR